MSKESKLKHENSPWNRIYLTHFVSPNEIYIRPKSLEEEWNSSASQKILHFTPNSSSPSKDPKTLPGKKVAILTKSNIWHRAQVTKVNLEKSVASCRLIDYGNLIEAVAFKDIRSLPQDLKELKAFSLCVKLHNVVPTGSSNVEKWTCAAKEVVGQVLRDREIFMRPRGVENDKVLVELSYEDSVAEDPFAPFDTAIISIKDVLVEKGLGLDPTSNKFCKSSSSFSWAKFEVTEKCFEAVLMNIDLDGNVYVVENAMLVEAMNKILTKIHSGLELEELNSFTGMAVIAKDPNDQYWKRGIVEKIEESGILEVLFVDEGQKVWLDSKANVCHGDYLTFSNVPVQALKMQLDKIEPLNENFSMGFILRMNVEFRGQKVKVKLTQRDRGILHLLEFDDNDGCKGNLARIFVTQGEARITKGKKESFQIDEIDSSQKYGDIISISEHFPDFKELPLTSFLIPIEVVGEIEDLIFFKPILNQSKKSSIEELETLRAEFEKMERKLQNETLKNEVKKVNFSHPYLAKNEENGLWSRCLIYFIAQEKASVLFVDYGKLQECLVGQLRLLPLEYMKVPTQTFHVDRANVDTTKLDDKHTLAVKIDSSGSGEPRIFYYENGRIMKSASL